MKQPGDEIWIKIRQYNCRMLVKLMKSLEAIPEGNGTMMDNTLIVYGSNNGNKQHTNGDNWPFVLIGNGGGAFKTGMHTRIDNRPLNDLYTTFLHGIGSPVDRFNIGGNLATQHKSKVGPIEDYWPNHEYIKLKLAVLLLVLSGLSASAFDFKGKVKPFLDKYCMDCHDADTEKGDISLENLNGVTVDNAELWKQIWESVALEEMPPRKKKNSLS